MVDLLKEGSKHLSGLEEAVLKNIEAVRKLSQVTKTCYGPLGMNKLIINKHGKQIVTSDAAEIINQLEFYHPAANMVINSARQQEKEIGDNTNLLIVFAGELMTQAEGLVRMGLHPTLIVEGYRKGLELFNEEIKNIKKYSVKDVKDVDEVKKYLNSVVSSKFYGYNEFLSELISKACIETYNKNTLFNVDNVRTVKILGGTITDSHLINGFVLPKEPEGTINNIKNAKVAIYVQGFEIPKTETKGTVLLKTAEEFKNFSKGEEQLTEKLVDKLAEQGVNVVCCGGQFSELALHYAERKGILLIRVQSVFDLRRLCAVTKATPMLSLTTESDAGKYGQCDEVFVQEIGSQKCTIFKQNGDSQVTSIIVRGSTQNLLDDICEAVDGAVCVYKCMTQHNEFVAGAGAFEIEMSKRINKHADEDTGLTQYPIKKYAEAFEIVPRTLFENAGLDATQMLSNLYNEHQKNENYAISLETGKAFNIEEQNVYDNLEVKKHAIELATSIVTTILLVDQIVMQKPAGGPKIPQQRMQGPMDSGDAAF